MSQKESVRKTFRSEVFRRDKFVCKICGFKPEKIEDLDCHHIINRFFMPFGGYVSANGITLCTDRCRTDLDCHQKAEHFNANGKSLPGFSPKELLDIIHSSHEAAYFDSIALLSNSTGIDRFIEKTVKILSDIKVIESDICKDLEVSPSSATWGMACEPYPFENDEIESTIITYGIGRQNVIDNGTEECHQRDS